MTSSFYRGASIVAIIYDVTSRESFKNLDTWINGIDLFTDGVVSKIILGNKCDLDAVVTLDEVKELASKYGIEVREISAKDGDGVDDAFECVAKQAVHSRKNSSTPTTKKKGTVKLEKHGGDKKCAC